MYFLTCAFGTAQDWCGGKCLMDEQVGLKYNQHKSKKLWQSIFLTVN
jgi:hypothetical protein